MAALPPVQAQAPNPAQDIVNTALEVARGGNFDFAIGIISDAQDLHPNNPLIERTLNMLIQRTLPQNAAAVQQAAALVRLQQAVAPQPYPNYAANPPGQQPPRAMMMPPMPLPNNRGAGQPVPAAYKPAPRLQPLPLPLPLPPDNVAQHEQLEAMRRIMEVHGQNGVNQSAPPQPQLGPNVESLQAATVTATSKRKRKPPAAKKKEEPNTPGFTPEIENHWRQKILELEATHKQESTETTSQIKELRAQIAAKKGIPARTVSSKKSQLRPVAESTQPAKKNKPEKDAAEVSEGSE